LTKKKYKLYFDNLRTTILSYFNILADVEKDEEYIWWKDLVGLDLNAVWVFINPLNKPSIMIKDFEFLLSGLVNQH